eukprot:10874699-Lingulodinium_polyedra.AAC.1
MTPGCYGQRSRPGRCPVEGPDAFFAAEGAVVEEAILEDRQRDLFPLPLAALRCPDASAWGAQGRPGQRRLARRCGRAALATDAVKALNELYAGTSEASPAPLHSPTLAQREA